MMVKCYLTIIFYQQIQLIWRGRMMQHWWMFEKQSHGSECTQFLDTFQTGLDFVLRPSISTLYRLPLIKFSSTADSHKYSIYFTETLSHLALNTKGKQRWFLNLDTKTLFTPHLFSSLWESIVRTADPTTTKTLKPQRRPTRRPTPILPELLLKMLNSPLDPPEFAPPADARSLLHLDWARLVASDCQDSRS